MSCAAVCLAVLVAAGASAADLSVARSVRPGNIDAAVAVGPIQVEYIDEGAQPGNIPVRNRVINLDMIGETPRWHRVSLFAKAGLSCSRLSWNGSGNGYRNRSGFSGENAGIGVSVQVSQRVSLFAQTVWMRYREATVREFESFEYTAAGVSVRF